MQKASSNLIFVAIALEWASGLPRQANVCESKECIASSHSMFEKMNGDADPCEDFNEFACGGFIRNEEIPEDKGKISGLTLLNPVVNRRGKALLEAETGKTSFETDKKLREMYLACTNEEEIEKRGSEPMKSLLQHLGGWPVLEGGKWTENDNDWYDIIRRSNQKGAGIDYIMSFHVSPDITDSTSNVMILDQPDLGIDREYLVKGFENKDVQAYYKFMVGIARALGAEEAFAKAEMKDALQFEIELAGISTPREERRNTSKLYNPTTIGGFDKLYGQPPYIKDYVNQLFSDVGASGVKVNDEEKIIVQDSSFMRNVSRLLATTSKRVAANYIGWRIVQSRLDFLQQKLRGVEETFMKEFKGVAKAPAAWKRCVNSVGFNSWSEGIPGAAASMYVRAHFPADAKEKVEHMISYIKKAFGAMLDVNTWMDTCTKVEARRKLAKLGEVAGYPDAMLDMDTIDEYYSGLEVSNMNHFENGLAAETFSKKKLFETLRQKVDRNYWTYHKFSSVVNAYYDADTNAMTLMAGIMQGDIFNAYVPQSLNFGAIGMAVGHEITHGFDDQGRQQDYEGNLVDWWEPEADAAFKERTQCVIDQYGNYTISQVGLNVNGVKVQGEAIADIGGIKAAYLAYRDWSSQNRLDPSLIGHDFTSNQLFWMSFARIWCTKYKDDTLKSDILTGVHPPGEARIIGALANNEDFARDFNCPLGSRMNPVNKCTVW